MIVSCANQLPPSGGDPDTLPPKIISVYPKPNTVLFKGNKLIFKFNEYVDRRSMQESFLIYPDPGGSFEFSWSGKETEITFEKGFKKNVTYLVTLGKDLKDVREGNMLGTPYRFAFSTGPKIDKGIIEGRVVSDNFDRVKIFGYKVNGRDLNPEKDIPEYITGTNDSGFYSLVNLSEGKYRLFAVLDDDRNNLYGKDFESISMLSEEALISDSSETFAGADFLLINPELKKSDKKFLNSLFADPSGNLSSNIENNGKYILPDQRFYFQFKTFIKDKSDIVNNFSVYDSAASKKFNLVFNWINDSLLEVFSTEKFSFSSKLKLIIDPEQQKEFSFSGSLNVIDKNNTGTIEGKIIMKDKSDAELIVKLMEKDNYRNIYSKKLRGEEMFEFSGIPEGKYIIFAYIDANGNGEYDSGNYFPYKPSERISVYEKELDLKGGWKINNVFIRF
ncbi:MAG: hypothetical protein HGGPFJEG_01068 [Ignavibacteria bacterium]|nr:hypothetical protein [Ignavibacteria bacterium]